LFTITLRQKPKGVTSILRRIKRQRESMRVIPLGYCLRVIVNKKTLNLEKTTSSVLSVLLLIYAFAFLPAGVKSKVEELSYNNVVQ